MCVCVCLCMKKYVFKSSSSYFPKFELYPKVEEL